MKTTLVALALLIGCATARAQTPTPVPSFSQLPTGNGFGFSVFDATAQEVTTFLERPYKYLTPGSDPHGEGVYRRDLAYDVYFGVRVGGTTASWMPAATQTAVGYVDQTGIIRSAGTVAGVQVESFFYEPFGLDQNALVMVAKATNTGTGPTTVDLFALPNFRLGGGGDPDNPSPLGETITTTGAISTESGNLGETGGSMVYLPLGPIAMADCNGDGFAAVQAGGALPSDTRSCTGDDKTIIFQSTSLSLAAGESKTFGLLIGFSPTISGAGAVGTAMATWVGTRTPDQILADSQTEWTTWRTAPPTGLSSDELAIYRQAETTLRMSQVREAYSDSPLLKNHGMILASLPPGIWHIGWVRDATYAIVALAQSGHIDEAKDGLRFFLGAQADGYDTYTNGSYRISITRYFGDGIEESDWNDQGPNIEFDGWGLFLWALRQTIDAAGDATLLQETLPTGEKFLDVVRSGVAEPLGRNLDANGLVLPDTSIWESHWDNRKHYVFTSQAAARGLCDLAALEQVDGDPSRADTYRAQSTAARAAIKANMLDKTGLLAGSVEGLANGTYHDAAALESFNFHLFADDDPLYATTLSGLDSKLSTGSSGWMRNDDALSSYDSNEWIFVDMRAANAFRSNGNAARADEIVGWVTAQARANYDLIPELYNTFTSDGVLWSYTGATPMVGFGAGAYILALRARAGQVENFDCGGASSDGGVATDGGVSPPKKSTGCGCAVGARTSIPCPIAGIVGIALLGLVFWRRRRT